MRERRGRDHNATGRSRQRRDLLADWDAVRAAQLMVEAHGDQAVAIAERRAESARELQAVKQWCAIAATIRAMAKKSS